MELEDPKDLRARFRKFLTLTNERKKMSKTTIRKRIALVAVSALTAGVISAVTVMPANAGIQALTNAAGSDTTFNVAVGTNNTGAAVIAGGVSAMKSLGLLYKDASSTTAQTATMLSSGALVLYMGATSGTATAAAFTASGGSFSGGLGAVAATTTYATNLRTIFFPATSTTVAAVWTPGATGTYTLNAYRGTTTTTPTLDIPTSGTLVGTVTVTVVASSAGSVYSAADSTCTVATTSTRAALDDVSSTVTNASWYVNYDLKDVYGVALPLGSIIATATTGGLVSHGSNGGSFAAGTDATAVSLDTGGDNSVRVSQAVAGAPTTTTVKITYNGTTVCTKTVTIRGSIDKLTVTVWGTQDLGADTYTSATYNHDGSNLDGGLFTVTALDSAGNIVTPSSTSEFSEVATTMGATIQALGFSSAATSTSSTSVHSYTRGVATCGNVAGEATVQLKHTSTATGKIVTSAPFKLRCADEAYTYTASWDKASYVQGEIATLTVKFLDSKGNPSNRKLVTAAAAATDTHVTAPMLTAVTAVTGTTVRPDINGVKTYTFTVGTNSGLTAGSYNAVVDYSSLTAVAATKQTPGYKVTTGADTTTNADVLKSIVALIASINKQIQALQKLILRNRR